MLTRQWMEVCEIWMKYICESPEEPLGKVKRFWGRHEQQDKTGNLTHLHIMLWICREALSVTQDRVRASMKSLIYVDEIAGLVEEGILKHANEVIEVREQGSRILCHKCNKRCQRRYGPGKDDIRCRVPNNHFESSNPNLHEIKDINVTHLKEAVDVLCDLGFMEETETEGPKPTKEGAALQATKYIPPTCAGEGIMSPCNGRLFAATRSSQNLQIVTGYFCARYLAKYVASIDENNRVIFGAALAHQNSLKTTTEFLHNTKITSSQIGEKKRISQSRTKNAVSG